MHSDLWGCLDKAFSPQVGNNLLRIHWKGIQCCWGWMDVSDCISLAVPGSLRICWAPLKVCLLWHWSVPWSLLNGREFEQLPCCAKWLSLPANCSKPTWIPNSLEAWSSGLVGAHWGSSMVWCSMESSPPEGKISTRLKPTRCGSSELQASCASQALWSTGVAWIPDEGTVEANVDLIWACSWALGSTTWQNGNATDGCSGAFWATEVVDVTLMGWWHIVCSGLTGCMGTAAVGHAAVVMIDRASSNILIKAEPTALTVIHFGAPFWT